MILDTISKQIQFSKEKEFISKLLINNKKDKSGFAIGGTGANSEKLRQLKAKQDSHESKFSANKIKIIRCDGDAD